MLLSNCFYKKPVHCRDQALDNKLFYRSYEAAGNHWFLEKEGVIFVGLSVILEVSCFSFN